MYLVLKVLDGSCAIVTNTTQGDARQSLSIRLVDINRRRTCKLHESGHCGVCYCFQSILHLASAAGQCHFRFDLLSGFSFSSRLRNMSRF